LDLTITLDQASVTFSTFQKPLNLYLYIPPLSAHPSTCLKGLIKGELYRYWMQNETQHFEKLTTKFIERLHARGHTIENLAPLFLQVAISLTYPPSQTNGGKNNNEDKNLFIHWQFHPNGLQRQDIRQSFNSTLQSHTPFERMIIAMSRPKNLRDILTRAALKLPEEIQIERFVEKIKLQSVNHSSSSTHHLGHPNQPLV
jgi:hypothetical protein